MLLPSMTYKEMYDHLASDLEKVRIKEGCLLSKAIREFKKDCKFPSWRWYEYTVPATKNKYIIYFYAESRANIDNPIVDNFSIVFDDRNNRYVLQWVAGAYQYNEEDSLKMIRQIHAYTTHFFERYNERILKNSTLNMNDIACIYLSRNRIENMMPIAMNEEINKNLEKYGDSATYGFRVRDGFCFARSLAEGVLSEDGDSRNDKIEAIHVMYATFMNETDMKDSQLSAIDKEHYNIWLRSIQVFQKEAKNGIISLTLEP